MTLHLDGPCGSQLCPFCRSYLPIPADPNPFPHFVLFRWRNLFGLLRA